MIKVRALRTHPYAGSYHKTGSVYTIHNKEHFRVLKAVRAIEPVIEQKSKRAIPKKASGKKANAKKNLEKKKTYKRKDMQAERTGQETVVMHGASEIEKGDHKTEE